MIEVGGKQVGVGNMMVMVFFGSYVVCVSKEGYVVFEICVFCVFG